jgi:hypothetical protein
MLFLKIRVLCIRSKLGKRPGNLVLSLYGILPNICHCEIVGILKTDGETGMERTLSLNSL